MLASHMEMQALKIDLLVIHFNLAKYFLAMICFLPSGMKMYNLCHCMLKVWICIFILILQDVTVKRLHWVLRDFDLLEGIETVIHCGSVEGGLNHFYIMIWWQAYRGEGVEGGGSNKNGPHRLKYLNAGFLGSVTMRGDLWHDKSSYDCFWSCLI